MSSGPARENRFLTAPIGRLFILNALPMALVMTTSGLLNVVDAVFLGRFVGAEALAAVSLVFPAVMLTIALSTLVSGGMSSLLARHLGAGAREAAGADFARAHGLALCVAAAVAVVCTLAVPVVLPRSGGAGGVTLDMARAYLLILAWGTPVQFLLGIHADALRNEGRAGLMALLSVGVTLANIVLNYVLIVLLGLGVAGSALGTVAAQALGLLLLLGVRRRDPALLALSALRVHSWRLGWRPMLLLGLPMSLGFAGMALVSATVVAMLRLSGAGAGADPIAAYGVATRIFGFAFMPLMALALATQSIVGNNVGAGLYRRSDAALKLALGVAFAYGLTVEGVLLAAGPAIGAGFVSEAGVVGLVGTILRTMSLLYAGTGPVLVLALYFQAVGQPGRTALLTLVKPFLLAPALVVTCVLLFGPGRLWVAFPLADGIVLALAVVLVAATLSARRGRAGFGLADRTGAQA